MKNFIFREEALVTESVFFDSLEMPYVANESFEVVWREIERLACVFVWKVQKLLAVEIILRHLLILHKAKKLAYVLIRPQTRPCLIRKIEFEIELT